MLEHQRDVTRIDADGRRVDFGGGNQMAALYQAADDAAIAKPDKIVGRTRAQRSEQPTVAFEHPGAGIAKGPRIVGDIVERRLRGEAARRHSSGAAGAALESRRHGISARSRRQKCATTPAATAAPPMMPCNSMLPVPGSRYACTGVASAHNAMSAAANTTETCTMLVVF